MDKTQDTDKINEIEKLLKEEDIIWQQEKDIEAIKCKAEENLLWYTHDEYDDSYYLEEWGAEEDDGSYSDDWEPEDDDPYPDDWEPEDDDPYPDDWESEDDDSSYHGQRTSNNQEFVGFVLRLIIIITIIVVYWVNHS